MEKLEYWKKMIETSKDPIRTTLSIVTKHPEIMKKLLDPEKALAYARSLKIFLYPTDVTNETKNEIEEYLISIARDKVEIVEIFRKEQYTGFNFAIGKLEKYGLTLEQIVRAFGEKYLYDTTDFSEIEKIRCDNALFVKIHDLEVHTAIKLLLKLCRSITHRKIFIFKESRTRQKYTLDNIFIQILEEIEDFSKLNQTQLANITKLVAIFPANNISTERTIIRLKKALENKKIAQRTWEKAWKYINGVQRFQLSADEQTKNRVQIFIEGLIV